MMMSIAGEITSFHFVTKRKNKINKQHAVITTFETMT